MGSLSITSVSFLAVVARCIMVAYRLITSSQISLRNIRKMPPSPDF